MFSYLGSKSKLAHLYPAPKHGRIVEPFAGSARYSLLHFENEVQMYDLSQTVVDIWRYLIAASERDILSLPDVPSRVSLDTFTQLAPVEKDLIGFHMCRGKAKPRKTGHGQNSWNSAKLKIARDLYKIRHWNVHWLPYDENWFARKNPAATWFIDPPYQMTQIATNSDRYPEGDGIDYDQLAKFVRTRNGLVIACEGPGADYLPFKLLKEVNANSNNKTVKRFQEFVYVQEN